VCVDNLWSEGKQAEGGGQGVPVDSHEVQIYLEQKVIFLFQLQWFTMALIVLVYFQIETNYALTLAITPKIVIELT